jgi:hypothetical protein
VGRDATLGTRNDGVGVLCVCFLTVEARERTDATEPEGDFGRETGEGSGAVRSRLGVRSTVVSVMVLSGSSPTVDAEDARDNDRETGSPEGVSLESGRGPLGRRGCDVDISLTLDMVECVLRATERIELPEDINGSL